MDYFEEMSKENLSRLGTAARPSTDVQAPIHYQDKSFDGTIISSSSETMISAEVELAVSSLRKILSSAEGRELLMNAIIEMIKDESDLRLELREMIIDVAHMGG